MLVPLIPSPPSTALPSAHHARMRLHAFALSTIFRCLFWSVGGLGAVGIVIVAVGGGAGIGIDHGSFVVGTAPGPDTLVPLSSLDTWQRLAGSASLSGRVIPALLILSCLQRLFALYASGDVFSADLVRQYKVLGAAITTYAIIPIPSHVLAWWAGLTPDAISIGSRQIEILLLGAAVVVVSHVMEIGREIEQDRSEII